jgi:hypothetical protein
MPKRFFIHIEDKQAWMIFLTLSIIWNLFIVNLFSPGYFLFDSVFYLDYLTLGNASLQGISTESHLYGLLMWVSFGLFGDFEALLAFQVAFAIFISSYYFWIIRQCLYSKKTISWLVLLSVSFFLPSLALQFNERDVLYCWTMLWIFAVQTKIIYLKKLNFLSVFELAMACILCAAFKPTAWVIPAVVVVQFLLAKFETKFLAFFVSVSLFFATSLVLLQLLVTGTFDVFDYYSKRFPGFKAIIEEKYKDEGGYSIKNRFRMIASNYSTARTEPLLFFPDSNLLQSLLDASEDSKRMLEYRPSYWTKSPTGFRASVEKNVTTFLFHNKFIYWFFNTILLGELVLLVVIAFRRFLPLSFWISLVPLSQFFVTFLFQPVGKARYFYFLYVLPYFLIPLILIEWRKWKNSRL